MSDVFLVTGPTGWTGRSVVDELLKRGAAVRAGVRDPEAAVRALPEGVEPVRLDFTRPETFAAAVAGVAGVYLMRPPPIARVGRTLNAFADTAVAAGVRHCVLLSVEGAERSDRIPHRRVELHLEAGPMPWTFLRPANFSQNLLGPYLEDVRRGTLVLPAGDGKVAFVDTRDVAEVAARALLDPGRHVGAAYTLTGPEAVTFGELAALVSEVTGRDVRYRPVGFAAYARHLLTTERASPIRIAVLSYVHAGIRRGEAATVDPTLGQLVGRPPRRVRDLVAESRALLRGVRSST